MSKTAADRLVSGAAWDDYCETLRRAGRMIDAFPAEVSELDRAEWYRYLTRVARNGFERFVENCEPERPRLRDAPWRQSINVQNPDQDHLLAEFVDGSHSYRVRGNRGTLPYFVMASWSAPQPADVGDYDWAPRGTEGLPEFDPASLTTTAFLKSDDIPFDDEGNFEVIVSQEPQEGPWLALTPDSVGILVRTVHHDRENEIAPRFAIERLDSPSPRPTTPAEMSAGLAKAGQVVLGYAEQVRDWWANRLPPEANRIVFSEGTYLSNGGVLDRLHGFGRWHKPEDHALVVHFRPPECESWILQLCNLWHENLDVYEDGQGYVTKFTARYESDGSVRAVIADADPGAGGNWIDSFAHTQGVFSLRLIKPVAGPPVTIHAIPLERLAREGFGALDTIEPILSGEITD